MLETTPSTNAGHHPKVLTKTLLIVLGLSCISLVLVYTLTTIQEPPKDFPIQEDIRIEEGLSLRDIADILEEKDVVRSSLYLYLLLSHDESATSLKAGSYRFLTPLSVQEVAEALLKGLYQSPLISVTFPEGFSTKDFFSYLPEPLHTDSIDLSSREGYLFPDTYFLSQDTTITDLVALMQKTFAEKIAPYTEAIAESNLTQAEVIILASIIEREAKDVTSKHIVSGILRERLRIGMPLQVDATFDYILDKASHELTEEDLSIDSPYNTYEHRGLPPTPIANPGIESIKAVLEPTKTEYLYYLTAPDGTFHYATTFEEHKRNKERYLR